MSKDLTEQWKNGELERGKKYWCKLTNGTAEICYLWLQTNHFTFLTGYQSRCLPNEDIAEVLAPVPSYEEWKIASEQLNKNGVWYTERSYKELKKEKRALEVSVSNRDNMIQELQEENDKLKELLKDARNVLKMVDTYCGDNDSINGFLIVKKIDEVLK